MDENIKYPKETKKGIIKIYYSGVSGRYVGKLFGMSKVKLKHHIKTTHRTEKIFKNYKRT